MGVHVCKCVQVCMYVHMGWACMWMQACTHCAGVHRCACSHVCPCVRLCKHVHTQGWVCQHLWLYLCVGIQVCGCAGVMGVREYPCPAAVHARGCACVQLCLCAPVCAANSSVVVLVCTGVHVCMPAPMCLTVPVCVMWSAQMYPCAWWFLRVQVCAGVHIRAAVPVCNCTRVCLQQPLYECTRVPAYATAPLRVSAYKSTQTRAQVRAPAHTPLCTCVCTHTTHTQFTHTHVCAPLHSLLTPVHTAMATDTHTLVRTHRTHTPSPCHSVLPLIQVHILKIYPPAHCHTSHTCKHLHTKKRETPKKHSK